MNFPFREARLKPIVVGILKYSPLVTKWLPVSAGGTSNARYCYAVWMRHLQFLAKHSGGSIPAKVAELGPGDSIGVGLAALLSGVENYFALDVIKYWNNERNLRILDELTEMFRNREKIPGNDEFPLLQPHPEVFNFPSQVISDAILGQSLNPDRIRRIREELMNPENEKNVFIRYKIPWYDKGIIVPESLDFIFSHTVLQHIDDIDNAYAAMSLWLKPGGFLSHLIDYKSMGFTTRWNGHWTFPDWEWRMMVGGRKFSINREPHSVHIRLFAKNHFKILFLRIENTKSTLARTRLATKYKSLSDEDLCTSGAYLIAQKELS
ncbi:MAG: class I SAM-dependent methyltransferase [Bacteroidales bacterium]|nr:class I SAM-dependent methyltransferase [Bacteroidales bacterium]